MTGPAGCGARHSLTSFGPLSAGLVQLDVASCEQAGRHVAVRQPETERVVAPRLAVVCDVHAIGEAAGAVDRAGAFDVPRGRVHDTVGGDAGALHVPPRGTVIDIGQMAPEP